MVKISKLADYAVVVMRWLSNQPALHYSAHVISGHIGIKIPTVSKVLKLLSKAGLVSACRGVRGGYCLSESPENISVVDIISAIDGELALTECSTREKLCSYIDRCEVREHWQYVNRVIYRILKHLTLRDMSCQLSEMKGFCANINLMRKK